MVTLNPYHRFYLNTNSHTRKQDFTFSFFLGLGVMADETFEKVADNASKVVPAQASAIRKGGHVVIKGRPCKVVETSTSKTGKHGHAKVHFVAIDIFTAKKLEDICPSTHNMDVPVVVRNEYSLLDITDDGYLSLLKPSGDTKDDLK
jgi:translation initiation factor 5A